MSWLFAAAAALLVGASLLPAARAQTIALAEEDATVWAQAQVVRGTAPGATSGTLTVNGAAVPFAVEAGAFAVPVRLVEPVTTIVACVPGPSGDVCSVPLVWTLGYALRPEAEVRATVDGRTVRFAGRVLDNPTGATLAFAWSEVPGNPAPLGLAVTGDSSATATVPEGAPPGEYTVEWTVTAAGTAPRRARTFVTVGADGTLTPFVLETDRAAWIGRATVYEVTPRHFPGLYRGSFDVIRQKLPELVALGVNTLWLQPVYPTTDEDQGYSVLDYFGVREDLGGEQALRDLVDAAHAAGLRVMFDFVPNHTALQHPYAQHAAANGARSHYYDFYQRTFDNAPYSQNYNYLNVGQMRFVYYFWDELVNLNFANPEVQRLIIEASRYWVEEFGIDGYRLDAVWGVQARNPDFIPAWRAALKRVRPDVFLLAEDKATDEALFDGRFDAAYDWTANTGYISQWAWQRSSQTQTLFNAGLEQFRARDLRNALTDFGRGYAPDALVFRYLENNDTPRFARNHTPAQTKMAAALMLALPGVPMLYYGQEAGAAVDVYDYPNYATTRTIASYDTQGFFPHYQRLLRARAAFPAFTSGQFAEVPVGPADVGDQTFAFRRWAGRDNVVGVVNMGDDAVGAVLALPAAAMGLDPATTYYLTDLLTGEAQSGTGADLAAVTVAVPPFTTRLFAVADSVVTVPTADEPAAPGAGPVALRLEPNVPNPFAGVTMLSYSVGAPGHVRLAVYDVLGREVARLVDGPVPAGHHSSTFDGSALAVGVYLCRLESEGQAVTRRMALVR